MTALRGMLAALHVVLVLAAPFSALADAAQPPAVADSLSARVEASLARHLDGEAIAAWLATLAPTSLEALAARWILAWLPLSDLVDLDRDLLREHAEGAAASWRDAPWRNQIDETLWLRYVVPHRVSQEPAQAWRRAIHEALWPRVANSRSMEEAALAVNRWCREQVTFTSTSGRDMGPLTTMQRGLGRCEEEMILCISALRAVGLPARSCATPYWAHTDNNHAWVEVWADGRWHYLGACEPDQCLDRAWFTGAARRVGFVRSVAYGEFQPEDEVLYRRESGATIINSTAVYTTPFRLTADLDLASRAPGNEAPTIQVNVFNFGSLRPIASLPAGSTLDLGPGEFALTAELDGRLCLQVVRGRPGERVAATLGLADSYDLASSPGFWLRYPAQEAGPRRDLNLVSEAEDALHRARLREREADRAKLRGLSAGEAAVLAELDPKTREGLAVILAKPMERASAIFLLLEIYPAGAGRAACLDFLAAADDKDLLELTVSDIRAHIDAALAVRHRLAPLGLALPDSLFRSALLPARIAREPGAAWRGDLPLVPLGTDIETSLSLLLERYRGTVAPAAKGILGAPLDPSRCWRLGLGSETDLAVTLVGLLRRNGFAARLRHERVELWLGSWRRLDPVAGSFWGETEDAPGQSAEPGRLDLRITRGGLPYPEAESYRDFNISRLEEGGFVSPWWDPVQGEQDWDADEYILGAGTRLPDGSVFARLRGFSVQPQQTCRVELAVDIGPGGPDLQNVLFAGPEPARVRRALSSSHVRDGEGQDLPPAGLFLLFEAGEPAARMIEALARVQPRLARLKIPLLPVLIGPGDAGLWLGRIESAGYAPRLWRDPAGELAALAEGDEGFSPLVMLEGTEGDEPRTLLVRRGFDAAIDGAVHLALDALATGP